MKCQRCLNEEDKFFYQGSKGWYCRKCISFKRMLIEEELKEHFSLPVETTYDLPFLLTEKQQACSKELCKWIQKEDVLIYAICGAGKTEMIMECIRQSLLKGLSIGIAIPRRQVVLEIANRMQKAFCNIKVTPVCGGYTDIVDGDLIVCTTHQLYRYVNRFDVLIVDEPDAFPYKGNQVLQGIVKSSCKGNIAYLTATPDISLKQLKTIQLWERPHGYPLPIPKVIIGFKAYLFICFVLWLRKRSRVLIFVPTIKMAKQLSFLLKVQFITSLSEDKEQIIEDFRQGVFSYLICTTILERGITLSNINVVVVNADHIVFDESSIIQIMGRLGRDPLFPKGDGLLLCLKKTAAVVNSVNQIQRMNV